VIAGRPPCSPDIVKAGRRDLHGPRVIGVGRRSEAWWAPSAEQQHYNTLKGPRLRSRGSEVRTCCAVLVVRTSICSQADRGIACRSGLTRFTSSQTFGAAAAVHLIKLPALLELAVFDAS